ncbi:MAG TPA: arginine deiminase family protein [Acidobacteriota bacterium]|nr:arginine deiminase family protein [Acidobacteriota bacterium]
MIAPLRRVVVKRPKDAFRDAAAIDAQWKALNYTAPPDLDAAEEEFEEFVKALGEQGAEALYLPPDRRTGLDSLYTHDPGLVTDAGAVLFQTGKAARRGEGPAMADAFKAWGIPVLGTFEGTATAEGGDMLWLDHDTLAVGRGFRTNAAGVEALRRLLDPIGITVLDFHLPFWSGPSDVLHLQSFISLLDTDLAVVFRRLLPVPLFEILADRGIELIDIPDEEYATQACNVLALAPRRLIMLERNPVTRRRMEAAGCEVRVVKGDEIAFKGSGGPTCLTRPVLRSE